MIDLIEPLDQSEAVPNQANYITNPYHDLTQSLCLISGPNSSTGRAEQGFNNTTHTTWKITSVAKTEAMLLDLQDRYFRWWS